MKSYLVDEHIKLGEDENPAFKLNAPSENENVCMQRSLNGTGNFNSRAFY